MLNLFFVFQVGLIKVLVTNISQNCKYRGIITLAVPTAILAGLQADIPVQPANIYYLAETFVIWKTRNRLRSQNYSIYGELPRRTSRV